MQHILNRRVNKGIFIPQTSGQCSIENKTKKLEMLIDGTTNKQIVDDIIRVVEVTDSMLVVVLCLYVIEFKNQEGFH